MIVCLRYTMFEHGQIIQSSGYDTTTIYLVMSGGVAVTEPTCFKEPILIYQKGAVINLY